MKTSSEERVFTATFSEWTSENEFLPGRSQNGSAETSSRRDVLRTDWRKRVLAKTFSGWGKQANENEFSPGRFSRVTLRTDQRKRVLAATFSDLVRTDQRKRVLAGTFSKRTGENTFLQERFSWL